MRYAPLPDVPTMADVGITGMDISFWHGLWGPKGMPKPIVDKLNDAVVKAFADPACKSGSAALGQTIPAKAELTPQSLHDYHKAETDKWWPIIRSYGIKVN